MLLDSDDESYDSEEDIIGVKKFVHVKLPKNYDPNKVPTTGEEYLQSVMYEAQRCDAIVTAKIDKVKDNNAYIMEETSIPKCPPSLLPTEEWIVRKVEEFQKFRKYIHNRLPAVQDKRRDIMALNTIITEYPTFSMVCKYHGNTLFYLTEIIARELNFIKSGETIPDKLGVWIYTTLALLQVPLMPDVCYNLRKIIMECCRIRAHLSPNASPEMYDPLNFFIYIIGRSFGQSDLLSSK